MINIAKSQEISTNELRPVVIAPDGLQGSKVCLGISNESQLVALKEAVKKSGAGMTIKNILEQANLLGIPRVDTI